MPHPQIYFFSLKGNGILSLGFLGFCSSLSVVDTVCCFLVSSIKSEVILICLPLFVMYSCCLKGGPVSSGSLELGDFFCLHQDMPRCVFMAINSAFYFGCSLNCPDWSVSSFQRKFLLLTVSFSHLFIFSLGNSFYCGLGVLDKPSEACVFSLMITLILYLCSVFWY